MIKDNFTYDKDKVDVRIVPMLNDFIFLLKPSKGKKVFIFQNDNLVTSYDTEIEYLKFYCTDKEIQYIYVPDLDP